MNLKKFTDELLLLRNEFVHNQLSPDKIENMLNEFDDKLNSQKTGSLISSEEKSNIIITLKKSIMDESSNSLLESIEKKFSKDIKRDKFLKDLRRQCGKTRNRLVEEINSLTRRGNLNLIIGVGTTIVAVTILFTTVLSGAKQLSNQELISYYVPRLTLSLFIEVFSFFFLKLYKAGLSEIKYFQNELTNAEMKFIAIEKSVMLEDVESQAKVIQTLSETERNFKLAKGESTVELEKYRSDQANSQAIMESVKGIISGVSNKSNLRN
ncbi:MAG: DUF389 domain-containing protein [Desulfobacterales bacterium]|nr:DUF389 domain-containing protein [Desulfobacterales bacterium]